MRKAMLTAKYCKENGYYFDKKITIDIDEENYFEHGVPFRFGFINANVKYDFEVPNIRTVGNQFLIQTFRDLDIKAGDKVRFNNKFYFVEDVNYNFIQTSQFKTVKQYFITVR